MDALEKRVKSRFSHRYAHISLAKSVSGFIEILKAALQIQTSELSFDERTELLGSENEQNTSANSPDAIRAWNGAIDVSFAAKSCSELH